MIVIAVIVLICLAIGVFSKPDNRQLIDYELYSMDADDYERQMTYSKEYNRGYNEARESIEVREMNALTLLNECRNSLTNDDFDKGWKKFCEFHLKTLE